MKEVLDKMVEEGWLISQVHPSLDLTIYNYSQKTQYESYWNEHTLMCRGLVLNSQGEIIARPFPKFFNWEEVKDKVPDEPYEIYEKVDGSLGIFFWYKGQPVFASRGSFTSEQSRVGWLLLQKHPYKKLLPNHTYLFEIVYPANRIVVDYGDETKIVLLDIINNSSGSSVPREIIEFHLKDHFDLVKAYHIKSSWDRLKSLNRHNEEGFVIKFQRGFRMKIKFEEYVRLHRIVTQVSNLDIWEKLMTGESLEEILVRVPDEFFFWVRKTEEELRKNFDSIKSSVEYDYEAIRKSLSGVSEEELDKTFALAIQSHEYKSLLFSLKKGRNIDSAIWKRIRPKWEKPFAKEEN